MSTPTLTSSEFLVDKPRWRIRSTIIEATINFSHSRRVDHSSGCIRRNAPQLHYPETIRSLCHWVLRWQVSSRMRDLLTSSTPSQSRQSEADVFLLQRADPAASSGSSIASNKTSSRSVALGVSSPPEAIAMTPTGGRS